MRRMVDPVLHRHVGNGKGIYSLQAADVVSVLLRVGPAPMMGVDATGAAEVVPGRVGVELVEPEMLRTSHDAKPRQRYRRHDRALPTTDGAVEAPGIHDAVRQDKLQFHGAAVATGAVPGLDGDATNFLEH